jgi:chromate transporter
LSVKLPFNTYGSGYVLVAFLEKDLVDRLGWLTHQQLLDAVAIGQLTPGPVFTTATLIGYVIAGHGGALAATVGIFLPAFIFAALVNPWIPKLRNSRLMSGFLDGINTASLALMAVVTVKLGFQTVQDPLTIGISLMSALLLLKYRVNSAWLVLGGGILGFLAHQFIWIR